MATEPNLIIFSSSKAIDIAYAIQSHLGEKHVTVWKNGFFEENKVAVWTFFKKLFCYDFAVLVLAGDEVIKEKSLHDAASETHTEEEDVRIPAANVVFELGAVMARLGPQKTFMVTPDDKHVRMPSYFDDVTPLILKYDNELIAQKNYKDATVNVCNLIKEKLNDLGSDAFHSELPAQGLAYGYMTNFVRPVSNASQKEQKFSMVGQKDEWRPEYGFTINLILPDQIMKWDAVSSFFMTKHNLLKISLKLTDGRDFGVYAIARTNEKEPLHIFDIPTTLTTASEIVQRINRFWQQRGDLNNDGVVNEDDKAFMDTLSKREIVNFHRMLSELIPKEELNNKIYIEPISSFPSRLQILKTQNGQFNS